MIPRKIAIVGLGLMGGSLGLALRKRKPGLRVIGVSRSKQNIRDAIRKKMITEGTTSLAEGVKSADLIVIAAPVQMIPALVATIDTFAKPGATVTDVGSTKGEILKNIRRFRLKNVRFVGSHPMAGSHRTGLAAAEADLYEGACVFVVREKETNQTALNIVSSLWRTVGAYAKTVSAKEHDKIAAQISQLPHLIASALVNTVPARALPFAASGFRDTTRIAQGDPKLWLDIVRTNRIFLVSELNRFTKKIDRLIRMLKQDQKKKLLAELTRAKKIRSQIRTLRK